MRLQKIFVQGLKIKNKNRNKVAYQLKKKSYLKMEILVCDILFSRFAFQNNEKPSIKNVLIKVFS